MVRGVRHKHALLFVYTVLALAPTSMATDGAGVKSGKAEFLPVHCTGTVTTGTFTGLSCVVAYGTEWEKHGDFEAATWCSRVGGCTWNAECTGTVTAGTFTGMSCGIGYGAELEKHGAEDAAHWCSVVGGCTSNVQTCAGTVTTGVYTGNGCGIGYGAVLEKHGLEEAVHWCSVVGGCTLYADKSQVPTDALPTAVLNTCTSTDMQNFVNIDSWCVRKMHPYSPRGTPRAPPCCRCMTCLSTQTKLILPRGPRGT
jgi:hypothetical protein